MVKMCTLEDACVCLMMMSGFCKGERAQWEDEQWAKSPFFGSPSNGIVPAVAAVVLYHACVSHKVRSMFGKLCARQEPCLSVDGSFVVESSRVVVEKDGCRQTTFSTGLLIF